MSRMIVMSVLPLLIVPQANAVAGHPIRFQQKDSRLRLSHYGKLVFEYVTKDDQVRRPYFHHLQTPKGIPVTRLHPPIKGSDLSDHPTMHPGLWMAFGDISGTDFWRNKGLVRHVEFLKKPQVDGRMASFSVRNSYEANNKAICTEDCEIRVTFGQNVTHFTWTSTFTPAGDSFYFGDQEEMGLGVRVTPALAVVNGGTIRDSEGRKNGKEVWGKQADWCEYTGTIDGKRIGVVLMPDPKNFRRSWFHARDYGLLLANPFGRNAFTKGEKSRVEVKSGRSLRLRYGILIYDTAPDIKKFYRDFAGVKK